MTIPGEIEQNRPINTDYDMLMKAYRDIKARWNYRRQLEDSTPEELAYLLRLLSMIETYDMEKHAYEMAEGKQVP